MHRGGGGWKGWDQGHAAVQQRRGSHPAAPWEVFPAAFKMLNSSPPPLSACQMATGAESALGALGPAGENWF